MEDVNDVKNDEQEDASHDDATVILPSRGKQTTPPPSPVEPEPAPVVEPDPVAEPEPLPVPVVEEKPVEPISMSAGSKTEEPIQMDSQSPIIPEVVGIEQNSSKKKWIIIAVVVLIVLCCCCVVILVPTLFGDAIGGAFDDIMRELNWLPGQFLA